MPVAAHAAEELTVWAGLSWKLLDRALPPQFAWAAADWQEISSREEPVSTANWQATAALPVPTVRLTTRFCGQVDNQGLRGDQS